jgi:hypothetical protein
MQRYQQAHRCHARDGYRAALEAENERVYPVFRQDLKPSNPRRLLHVLNDLEFEMPRLSAVNEGSCKLDVARIQHSARATGRADSRARNYVRQALSTPPDAHGPALYLARGPNLRMPPASHQDHLAPSTPGLRPHHGRSDASTRSRRRRCEHRYNDHLHRPDDQPRAIASEGFAHSHRYYRGRRNRWHGPRRLHCHSVDVVGQVHQAEAGQAAEGDGERIRRHGRTSTSHALQRDLLAVRENTRRNAQTLLVPRSGTHYTAPSRMPRRGSRKIKFAAFPGDVVEKEPIRTPSPAPLTPLKDAVVLPDLRSPSQPPTRSFLSRAPRTPWGSSVLPAGGPVIMPRPKIARPEAVAGAGAEEFVENTRWSRGSFESRRLRHMPSAVSSESIYSTQSGEARVEGPRLREQRSGFFATLRQQLDVNRLSAFSIGSLYSIDDD